MPKPGRRKSSLSEYKLLLSLAAVLFAADQLTKVLISRALEYGSFYPPHNIEVIPGFFHLVHVGNTGAAWSLFTGYSVWLAAIGFAALAAIWFLRDALELSKTTNQWAFGLIVGGILGNVLDRLRLGHVVDFLDFQFGNWHFPSFNVADSAITVGVSLYAIASLLHDCKNRSRKSGRRSAPTDSERVSRSGPSGAKLSWN